MIDQKPTKELYYIERGWFDRYWDQYYFKNVTTVNQGSVADVTFDSEGLWQYSGGNYYFEYQNSTGSTAYASSPNLWGDGDGQLYTTVNQDSGQLENVIDDLEPDADYYPVKEFVSSFATPQGSRYEETKYFTQKEKYTRYQHRIDKENVHY